MGWWCPFQYTVVSKYGIRPVKFVEAEGSEPDLRPLSR